MRMRGQEKSHNITAVDLSDNALGDGAGSGQKLSTNPMNATSNGVSPELDKQTRRCQQTATQDLTCMF